MMKKLFFSIATVTLFNYAVNAQFDVEAGVNFNSPTGDFADLYDFGVGGYLEPKYAISKHFDVGLLMAFNGFGGSEIVNPRFGERKVDPTSFITILPTATYKFKSGKVIPYVGLGVGMYVVEDVSFDASGNVLDNGRQGKFGFSPRAGVHVGRVNLGASYNIVNVADFVLFDNFLQFNVGISIFGRKK